MWDPDWGLYDYGPVGAFRGFAFESCPTVLQLVNGPCAASSGSSATMIPRSDHPIEILTLRDFDPSSAVTVVLA
jgi:hypothetical protein